MLFAVALLAELDPGTGAFLAPGSGIRNRYFSDPGSRIPDPKSIFWNTVTILGQKVL
jgi:hypothetical protein